MFLQDILKEDDYKLLIDKYTFEYLDNINYDKFMIIYKYLRSLKIYYIDDLIINYLDIFELDLNLIKEAFFNIKSDYGEEYIFIIGSNLKLLEDYIIKIIERY